MVNPPPFGSPVDANGNRPSTAWTQWFNQLSKFINGLTSYAALKPVVATTGFSITLGNTQTVLQLNPAGTLSSGAIVMPPFPYDGQPITVATTQTITSLTVSANIGQTILNAPTTLVAGGSFMYYYNRDSMAWFRIQ